MTGHDGLKDVANEFDWFATITIPTPSKLDDVPARFELEWTSARRQLSDTGDDDDVEQLDELVGGLRHGDSASLVIVHAHHGSTLIEGHRRASPKRSGRTRRSSTNE